MGCVACRQIREAGDDEDSSGPTTSWLEDHQQQYDIETIVQSKNKTPSPSLSSADESIEEVESPIPKVLQHTRANPRAKRNRRTKSKAQEFWAAQSKQIAKDKKERNKRAKKT